MNTGNYGTMLVNDVINFFNLDMEVDDYKNNFPPTDIYKEIKTGTAIFEFAVAGYDPAEISIKFSGDKLELDYTPTKKGDKENEEDFEYFKRRIAKRAFHLDYSLLTGHYDTTKAVASHENGILKIEIPTSEYVKPRNIKIKIN